MGVVCVKLHELPIELFRQDILVQVAKKLGQSVKIDNNTLKGEGKCYANICVLVNVESKPMQVVWVGNVFQEREYLGGSWYCSKCNKFGHL